MVISKYFLFNNSLFGRGNKEIGNWTSCHLLGCWGVTSNLSIDFPFDPASPSVSKQIFQLCHYIEFVHHCLKISVNMSFKRLPPGWDSKLEPKSGKR